MRPSLELLEDLTLLSGAFDVIGLTALRADPAFQMIDGDGIGVAIIDSGVLGTHQDLAGNFVAWYHAPNNQEVSNSPSAARSAAGDPNGHGTHVAGTTASSNPEIGVAYRSEIIGIQAWPGPNDPQTNRDGVAEGLQWVINNHQRFNIKVVNMSLGMGTQLGALGNSNDPTNPQLTSHAWAQKIRELEALGITVVVASGNHYAHYASAGAAYPAIVATLSVGNTWEDNGAGDSFPTAGGHPDRGDQYLGVELNAQADRLAATSQRSTAPNQVVAPGSTILSTYNDGGYATLSGTSMASPLVAGVVALLQDAAQTFGGRYLTTTEVRNIVRSSADVIRDAPTNNNGRLPSSSRNLADMVDLPETNLDFYRVNVNRAVRAVQQLVSGGQDPGGTPSGQDVNNTINTAIPISQLDGNAIFRFQGNIGTDGRVSVGANDVDLFRIELRSPGVARITTSLPAGGTAFDGYLRLFNSSGTQVAFEDDTAGSLYPTLVSPQLPAGTYYFGISSYNNSAYNPNNGSNASNGQSQGDYLLEFSLENPDPNGVVTGAVDFLGVASPVYHHTGRVGWQVVGTIESDPPPLGGTERVQVGPDDVDMFDLIAPDDATLTIDIDAVLNTDYGPWIGYGGQAVDSYVRVFEITSTGIVQVASNDDDPNDGSFDSYLQLTVSRGRRYIVAVSDYWNSSYDPANPYGRSDQGSGGRYTLTMFFDNGDRNGSVFDAWTEAEVGQTLNGVIGTDFGGPTIGRNGSLDVDYIRYVPASSGLLDVSVVSPDNTLDPVLSIWSLSPAGDSIDLIANTAGRQPSHIIDAVAGQTYYVAVTGRGNENFQWFAAVTGTGGDTGNYQLTTRIRNASERVSLGDDTINLNTGWETIALDQVISGEIGKDGALVSSASDVDLYRFQPTTSGNVVIRTLANQAGSADTFLRLFNAAGQELAFNDNATSTTIESRISVRVEAGQTYFIGVNGASSSARNYNPLTGAGAAPGSVGTYQLSISRDTRAGKPGDFDGNGISDVGIFNIVDAFYDVELSNAAGAKIGDRDFQFGLPGTFAIANGVEPLTDFPIPGDYNGDGINDRAVFRIATAEYLVQYLNAQGNVIAARGYQFGFPGNFAIANGLEPLQDIPVPGDYNGDGVYDLAVFRVATAEWLIRLKNPGFEFANNLGAGRAIQHGLPGRFAAENGLPQLGDVPVPGDYDGNGVTDFGVYRRVPGNQQGHWLIRLNDANGNRIGGRETQAVWKLSDNATIQGQGGGIDVNIPIPADYDGNGVTDVAVWHAPTADWRIVLMDRDGNVINRNDDGSSNTRRKVFGRRFDATAPAWRRYPDVPLLAPFSSLIKLRILPGLPRR